MQRASKTTRTAMGTRQHHAFQPDLPAAAPPPPVDHAVMGTDSNDIRAANQFLARSRPAAPQGGAGGHSYGLQLHREPKHKSEHNILTVKTESEETQDKTAMIKDETAKIKAEASAEAKRKRAQADLINAQAQKLQAQNTNVAFTKMIQMMKLQQHQEEQEAQQQQQQEKQTMKMMKFMDGMMKKWGAEEMEGKKHKASSLQQEFSSFL